MHCVLRTVWYALCSKNCMLCIVLWELYDMHCATLGCGRDWMGDRLGAGMILHFHSCPSKAVGSCTLGRCPQGKKNSLFLCSSEHQILWFVLHLHSYCFYHCVNKFYFIWNISTTKNDQMESFGKNKSFYMPNITI